jgi:hypothetical protein
MADHLRTDLHQLFPQHRERPRLDLLWQSKRPHQVGEIVGQARSWSRAAVSRNFRHDSRVHVARVLATSRIEGENLVKAMITGRKRCQGRGER